MVPAPDHYLIALGSNMRSHRHGRPADVIAVALELIAITGVEVVAASPVFRSRPLGPSQREYANAAALVRSGLQPPALMRLLHGVEATLGRKRRGRRWQARVCDCDIVLWGGGEWEDEGVIIPHPDYRWREFVLRPAMTLVPGWRDPVTGHSIAQLFARLTRSHALTR
ncbi:2-amino-4-hydroxy-6-hydroxymethyldihydropteridine diphosphokinase [Qipengyuania nanhaisediminis]|uniref:2-amino-4-hydroxy-6- hydroxymethyldihydropteridine diphosphokinase n=1 Tax=Qipengyuania nanhaisediminis TaxID=604088 RepID=UPI0038B338FA